MVSACARRACDSEAYLTRLTSQVRRAALPSTRYGAYVSGSAAEHGAARAHGRRGRLEYWGQRMGIVQDRMNESREIGRSSGSRPAGDRAVSSSHAERDLVGCCRVLIAEDDAAARALLVAACRSYGHDVVAEAASGREAAALAREHAPDVALLGVRMRDGSGLEAGAWIAADLPRTAVVLLTGDADVALTDAALALSSAVSVLAKPVLPSALDVSVRLAAARARTAAALADDAVKARRQLEERKLVERAKGILMRRTGSSEAEAYRILQRSSQDRSTPMAKVAQAVIDSEPGVPRS